MGRRGRASPPVTPGCLLPGVDGGDQVPRRCADGGRQTQPAPLRGHLRPEVQRILCEGLVEQRRFRLQHCAARCLEPKMWLTLAGQLFPQISYGGFIVPKMETKPDYVERYEDSDRRGLLDFLRKSNDQGDVVQYLKKADAKRAAPPWQFARAYCPRRGHSQPAPRPLLRPAHGPPRPRPEP